MRAAEFVTLAYLAYVMLLTVGRSLAPQRRIQIQILCAIAMLAVLLTASGSRIPGLAVMRDWMPAVYVLVGYWLSGRFYTGPMLTWETKLAAIDRRLFAAVARRGTPRTTSPLVLAALELAYLSVYALVPAGFALLYFSETAFDVDRFWTVVLVAELACYAALPWVQTRPPRVLETETGYGRSDSLRRANLVVLRYGSIQVNSFPSGHASGAVATALAVAMWRPKTGFVLLGWAIAVVVGSVVGRYHYAADSVLGAAVGVAAWLVVRWIWP